jgi:predicted nucleic acid-binding protein
VILATAVSARADYLVTGDRQLLALGEYQGVQMVTPRDFLAILSLQTSATR